jgi:hypothetical protein
VTKNNITVFQCVQGFLRKGKPDSWVRGHFRDASTKVVCRLLSLGTKFAPKEVEDQNMRKRKTVSSTTWWSHQSQGLGLLVGFSRENEE